jgi:hypothetical protein
MYFWIFLVVWGSQWLDLLAVIFLDGEFEAAKSTFCTFHQFHRFFSHFWRDLERQAPRPGLGPLISDTGHMESLRSTLYGIRGFGIEAARKVSDDSFGDKKLPKKHWGL